MFYIETTQADPTLRFGDVIRDFPICFPVVSNPSLSEPYHIQVNSPAYSVVLSPCCSISDKVISIAPLQMLNGSLFSNPFLLEDPKRINIKIPADKSLPPRAWETMNPTEKAERLSKQDAYVFVDNFVYDTHPLFPEYVINRKEGNITSKMYVIDFRTAVRIQCDKISNPTHLPGNSKVLQLTIESRDQLRKKIGSFYQRIPDEDAAILAT
jgi:hypothetical protein